jgi:hypothetical protein
MKSAAPQATSAAMPDNNGMLKVRVETHDLRQQGPGRRETGSEKVRFDEELFFLRTVVREQAKALDAIRGSYGWRLSRPLRKAWTFVKSIAARTGLFDFREPNQSGQLPYALQPINDIEPDVAPGHLWRSNGSKPCFSVRHQGVRRFSGWYMIEIKLTTTTSHSTASFYFQDRSEKNEKRITLLCRNGQMAKRVVEIKTPVSILHFSPMSGKGRFCVDHLRFAKIPPGFAVNRMIKKIQRSHESYRGKSVEEIKRIVRWQAAKSGSPFKDQLYSVYSQVFDNRLPSKSYEDWIEAHEVPLFSDVKTIKKSIARFAVKPLISVILPVYNTDEHFLRQCIRSVLHQSYPHWEL